MAFKASIRIWLLMIVLASTVPLIIFLLYLSYTYALEKRASIEAKLIQRTEFLAHKIGDKIGNTLGYINSLALSEAAQTGDIKTLYEHAVRIQNHDADIRAISLTNANADLLFLSLRPLGEKFPAGAPESVRAVFATGKPQLSGPFKSPISDAMVVTLSVPIVQNGRVIYALRAVLLTSTLNQMLHKAALPDQWIATLADAKGLIVARSHVPEIHVGKSVSADHRKAIDRMDYDTIWTGTFRDGVQTHTVLRPIGTWGWHLIMGVPSNILIAPLYKALVQVSVVAFLFLLVVVSLAILLARRISRETRAAAASVDLVLHGKEPPERASGIKEIDEMHIKLGSVDRYQKVLEDRVTERTTALLSAQARAARFADNLEQSIESERQRLAREVHDQIGSVFTGIKLIITGADKSGLSPGQHQALLAALDSGLQTARRIAAELRPPLFDDLGLQIALDHLLKKQFAPNGISHEVHVRDEALLSERQAITIYRILQEACVNVLRHAQATHVVVSAGPDNASEYQLTFQDNGVGMPEHIHPGALGLAGMQERAELIGGSLSISGQTEGGTRLTLRIPLVPTTNNDKHEHPAA